MIPKGLLSGAIRKDVARMGYAYRAALVILATGFAGTVFAGVPSISNLDDTTFIGGQGPVVIDSDITVTGGSDYTEGFIRFNLTNGVNADQLVLTDAAIPTASGAISVSGIDVYMGDGATTSRIGTIDASEDGSAGNALKILFSAPLDNSGFEDDTTVNIVSAVPTGLDDSNSWTVVQEEFGDDNIGSGNGFMEIDLDGMGIDLATVTPYSGGTGTINTVTDSGSMSFNGEISANQGVDASAALYLYSNGNIEAEDQDPYGSGQTDGYGSIHGPYAISSVFSVADGDTLKLDFKAVGSGDDYEVFGLIRRVDTNGNFISGNAPSSVVSSDNVLLFAQRGDDTNGYVTITKSGLQAGDYRFQFIGGTYDYTGGLLVGSNLYVDNIRLISASTVDDTVIETIATQVTYDTSGCPLNLTDRTMELSVESQSGDTDSATSTITMDPAPDDLDNDCIADVDEGGGTDTDGDGTPDSLDSDTDGDGLPDVLEGSGDSDGDGVADYRDLDSDNDGIPDSVEVNATGVDTDGDGVDDAYDVDQTAGTDSNGDGVVESVVPDSDGDGVVDYMDLDSDNDGLSDLIESGVNNPATLDSDNDGRVDSGYGSNGLADILETSTDSGIITYNVEDTDSDGVEDFRDLDADNDGIHDVIESGGSDGDNDGVVGSGAPAVDGDGLPAGGGLTGVDTDSDGTANYRDLDSDGDGIYDVIEAGGSDGDDDGIIGTGAPSVDGSGLPAGGSLIPVDSTANGTPDYLDDTDTDNDGIVDSADPDSDNDGIDDIVEGTSDVDGDGLNNLVDLDSDNDGIPDSEEAGADTDGDGVDDYLDLDSDNDGIADLNESGIYNPESLDGNNDGRIDAGFGSNGLADIVETTADSGSISYIVADSDDDGVEDFRDLDSDNDGLYDVIESGGSDADDDGRLSTIVDADGIPNGGLLSEVDSDGDTIPDFRDLDSDNDGLFDIAEANGSDGDNDGVAGAGDPVVDSDGATGQSGLIPVDTDSDGVEDQRDLDSDNDGIPDVTETGGSDDDGDGIIGSGTPAVDDSGVYTGGGLVPVDTDNDGTPNQRDLDSDGDGSDDIVEAGGIDGNGDGSVDGFTDTDRDGFDDVLTSTPLPMTDSDLDGTPDFKTVTDTDGDGINDDADLDADNDGIPDTDEGAPNVDSDSDGIPDYLDLDSDNDGIFDLYESGITDPGTKDADGDGRIDSGFGSNGLADVVESSADSGARAYTILDTDSDTVRDFRDVDSDNDSITDVVENGGTDGDGDGRIGSGIPEVNDNGIPATSSGITRDSDSDGDDDARDLDSNDDGTSDLVGAGGTDSDGDGMVDDFNDGNGDGLHDSITAVSTSGDEKIQTGLRGVGGCTVVQNAPFDPTLPLLMLVALIAVNRKRIRNVVTGENC